MSRFIIIFKKRYTPPNEPLYKAQSPFWRYFDDQTTESWVKISKLKIVFKSEFYIIWWAIKFCTNFVKKLYISLSFFFQHGKDINERNIKFCFHQKNKWNRRRPIRWFFKNEADFEVRFWQNFWPILFIYIPQFSRQSL